METSPTRSISRAMGVTASTLIVILLVCLILGGFALGACSLRLQLLEDLEDFAVSLGRLVFRLLLAGIADQRAHVLHVDVGMAVQQFGQRLVIGQQLFAAAFQ